MMQNPTQKTSPDTFEMERAQAQTTFESARQPFAYLKQLTKLTDDLLKQLWQEHEGKNSALTLVATGGYGRGELYPYSDIDLLILHEGDSAEAQAMAEPFFQVLWDRRFKLGHACRSVNECLSTAADDATVLTSLLDARYITGNKALFKRFQDQFAAYCEQQDSAVFLEAKLEERQKRLEKYGKSRFLLEPNVKENVGGLRDLHLLYWLARFHYRVRRVSELVKLGILEPEEYRRFRRAHQFLATVRIQLHHLAGRADERLTFEKQKQLGEWLGYRSHEAHQPVERFMKRYFQTTRDVSQLTRLFSALLEEETQQASRGFFSKLFERTRDKGAFTLRGKRLDIKEEADLDAEPILMLDYFALAQSEGLSPHPHALHRISRHLKAIDHSFRQSPEANARFLAMMLSNKAPHIALMRMNDAGIIGAFIPDFARLVGQIQYDRYHVYTVDEHTIRLIAGLHGIEHGELKDEHPISSEIIHQIGSRRALFFAAFCHDIAKGRGGGHEQLGVSITRKLGARFGLEPSEINLAAWLVEHHLLMSHTAFSRDLDDPQTIIDFVHMVQSPERLKCLLLLTVVDIRAVGPGIWNGWKGALLRDLFARSEAEMGAPQRFSRETRIEQARMVLESKLEEWPDALREKLLSEPSPAFWLTIPAEQHLSIAAMLRQVWENHVAIAIDYSTHLFEAITHVRLCLPDHHGLLQAISGCITRIGGSILSIKSVTLQDGLVVMLLDIQDKTQNAYEDGSRLKQLPSLIQKALADPEELAAAVEVRRPKQTARNKALAVAPEIYIDNHLSVTHTVIEVDATDRIGLLYDITGTLTRVGLNIQSSHITTYGEKAVDVFYVKDAYGQKITNEAKIQVIRRELLAMLAYAEWKEH